MNTAQEVLLIGQTNVMRKVKEATLTGRGRAGGRAEPFPFMSSERRRTDVQRGVRGDSLDEDLFPPPSSLGMSDRC